VQEKDPLLLFSFCFHVRHAEGKRGGKMENWCKRKSPSLYYFPPVFHVHVRYEVGKRGGENRKLVQEKKPVFITFPCLSCEV
jgi:hypothetical protein